MTLKDYIWKLIIEGTEETPGRSQRRAENKVFGGENPGPKKETPALGWRRASDTLTGGVYGFYYSVAGNLCQGHFGKHWRAL